MGRYPAATAASSASSRTGGHTKASCRRLAAERAGQGAASEAAPLAPPSPLPPREQLLALPVRELRAMLAARWGLSATGAAEKGELVDRLLGGGIMAG